MKITLAKNYGFCYGVKRAVEIACQARKEYNNSIATMGPLIHNQRVIENLQKLGINCKDSLDEFNANDVVIFRSHGVGPKVYLQAKEKKLQIVDATCPNVRSVQTAAETLGKEGRFVVIIGEKKHPEVQSIKAWAGDNSCIVETESDVESVPAVGAYGVVSQTTWEKTKWEKLLNILKEQKPGDYKVMKTICNATTQRQEAAKELASQVDAVFVFGGKTSANTRHLWELVKAINPRSYLLETADDIKPEMLYNIKEVGITAGASTPAEIIEEAIVTMETMESLLGEKESMRLHLGMVVEATVVAITEEEVVVDFGYQSEGSVAFDQWEAGGTKESVTPKVKVGDKVTLKVVASENQDGLVILSRTKAVADAAWTDLPAKLEAEKEIDVKGLRAVKGGLTVSLPGLSGITGFIPASHLDLRRVENIKEFEGKELKAAVLEINPEKKRLVLSRRNVLREEKIAKTHAYKEERAKRLEERKEALDNAFTTFKEGTTVHGVVKNVVDFGMFVEIAPYVQGLVHVSELSWDKGAKPADLYKPGDEVDVYIKGLDPEKGRISLSIKELLEDPWQTAVKELKEGQVLTGKVIRFLPFGAIVKIKDNVEGMVHISEIANERIDKPEDVLKLDQEVTVKILHIDTAEKKIGLSISKAKEDAAKAEVSQFIDNKEELSQGLGEKLAAAEEKKE
ncbi:MAG: bifunctional 4-hydroxy-3-methylbut-2-enyl diphosphate reductase/30S ribosomal protein S1 [Acidaminococcaceae bacterium]|jgi:4-hydroxy-3-methylbut-2-enyl diphosphate reductase|nr:bifunctional 4-hydroxy-3-methylbut-2-enyl diphosphate reductase/30S ribosomal protein S1 [Acidaminococcaceae bacterium]